MNDVDAASRKRRQRRSRTIGSARVFPLQPLLDLYPHHTPTELARLAGLDRNALTRGPRIRWDIADRAAISLGLHPAIIWPDWAIPEHLIREDVA